MNAPVLSGIGVPRTPTQIEVTGKLRVLALQQPEPTPHRILPDSVRAELSDAEDDLSGASSQASWAVPYFVLGVAFWWPACLIAVVLALAGWRGRAGVGAFATIGESAVDLYGRMLAVQLGLAPADGGPLFPEVGEAITRVLRKNR